MSSRSCGTDWNGQSDQECHEMSSIYALRGTLGWRSGALRLRKLYSEEIFGRRRRDSNPQYGSLFEFSEGYFEQSITEKSLQKITCLSPLHCLLMPQRHPQSDQGQHLGGDGMSISGHRTNSTYKHYGIINENIQRQALESAQQRQQQEINIRKVVPIREVR